jgi:tRNA (guanine37-N1)-methyltransferase
VIIDIITIFPDMVRAPLAESMLARAAASGLLTFNVVNLRDFTHDRHHVTDDYPYGGGEGMVMKPEPIFEAVEALLGVTGLERPAAAAPPATRIILMCPQGRAFTQEVARELSGAKRLIFVCGHYEGIDERVRLAAVTDELSIGDYVLTGGELPALVVVDAVARLIPGVLGAAAGSGHDSFGDLGVLEGPQYTRPSSYRGLDVPEVLLSGDHGRIARWRRRQALARTLERRPDLLERARLSPADAAIIEELGEEAAGRGGRLV